MRGKLLFVVALILLGSMALYFLTHPSYERSLEAKFYYNIGDYKQAYLLAKEAFEIDP